MLRNKPKSNSENSFSESNDRELSEQFESIDQLTVKRHRDDSTESVSSNASLNWKKVE